MKNIQLLILICFIGITSLNAKDKSALEEGRLCHEIAWNYALSMQQEFGLYGHEMELIYEETYNECENEWDNMY